jgi:hypothetical protein
MSAASPGQFTHHYMPPIPLVIVSGQDDGAGAPLSAETRRRLARTLHLPTDWSACELILHDAPTLAARELYSDLRRLAASGASVIYVRATRERQQEAFR